MPDMDGLEMCEHLKADETLKNIPVIFISALSGSDDKINGFAAGAVDYVTKPFRSDEVIARVRTHLRLRWLQSEMELHNRNLEELVREKVQEISDSHMSTIFALVKLAEYRDEDTGLHIERTRTFCRILALKLQENPFYANMISDAYVDNIFHAAPLHDIGKVGIPDGILQKPGKLTPEEFEIMKTHTTIGARTLEEVHMKYPRNEFLSMGISIARSHHERWDGTGYPDGLSCENIPLCARIMALSDVYDALRSKRVYKSAFSHEEACRLISDGAGSQFDPSVFEAFKFLSPEFSRIRDQMDDVYVVSGQSR